MNVDLLLFLAIIFIVIFSFIAVVVIILVHPKELKVGSTCDVNNNKCASGLVCDKGICKIPLGGSCSTVNNCISGSTFCFNGTCSNAIPSDVGGPCPCLDGLSCESGSCRVPVGGSCDINTDCVSAATNGCVNGPPGSLTGICSSGGMTTDDYMDTIMPACTNNSCSAGMICEPSRITNLQDEDLFPFVDSSISDITMSGNKIYLLQENGNIMVIGSDKRKVVQNKLGRTTGSHLVQILSIGNKMFGLDSQGKLFLRVLRDKARNITGEYENPNVWKWYFANWAMFPITHMSRTLDDSYIWFQNNSRGELYKIDYRLDIKLDMIEENLNKLIREYGRSKNTFVELDNQRHTAIRYPLGDEIYDVYAATLMENGQLVAIYRDLANDYVKVKMIGTNELAEPVFITKRLCL